MTIDKNLAELELGISEIMEQRNVLLGICLSVADTLREHSNKDDLWAAYSQLIYAINRCNGLKNKEEIKNEN